MNQRIVSLLGFVYGEEAAAELAREIDLLLDSYRPRIPKLARTDRFATEDAVLICYGDMVRHTGEPPLRTLGRFLSEWGRDTVNSVHLLPFFPYSSDDGFSVINYYQVDPQLGGWENVAQIGADFRLMFDAVINHISAESSWFRKFKQGIPPYDDFFVTVEPEVDLSAVFRPRTSPLLLPVNTVEGTKHVWTTFSSDQIDLNYANPRVTLQILDLLLFYVARGAELIRLDAIAFMWKEPGTRSLHQPETHALIQLMRAVLDEIAPHVALITETNVPHEENVSYFGDGTNEAQMVYNFSLPPLTLHAFHTADAGALTRWASGLTLPSKQVTFFNFLASHDGIGVTPARGLLSPEEIATMARRVEAVGGYVSYRTTETGEQAAYELNCNYFDALREPENGAAPEDAASRFVAAQAIMFALRGVPGIYFHSLFGSRNWQEGVEETGRYRTINRQRLNYDSLQQELTTPGTLRYRVYHGLRHLLLRRRAQPAFHPMADQHVLDLDRRLFTLLRSDPAGRSRVLCLHNVSGETFRTSVAGGDVGGRWPDQVLDLVNGEMLAAGGPTLELEVEPYQVRWIQL